MKKLILTLALFLIAICNFAQKIYIPDLNFRLWLQANYASCMSGDSLVPNCYDVVNTTSMNVAGRNIANLTGIEAFTGLTILYCNVNQLTELNVSANTGLNYLYCNDNLITALDLSSNTALSFLSCYNNQLSSFNVSTDTALQYLICYNNHLTDINVSTNTALIFLNCNNDELTSLDVTANTGLTELICSLNKLTSLNLSTNTALTSLDCAINELINLDVKNGNNTNLLNFNALGNPKVCIQVDNVVWSTSFWTNIDADASFSENCSINIPSLFNTSKFKIYSNPIKELLIIDGLQSGEIEIMNLQGQILRKIDISNTTEIIDISKLSSGLYVMSITTKDGIFFEKIIKE